MGGLRIGREGFLWGFAKAWGRVFGVTAFGSLDIYIPLKTKVFFSFLFLL